MRIARNNYLNKLIARKHNSLVKVITGIRRCGKSYLLFELFKEHLVQTGVQPDHIVEIQLDDRANRTLRDPDACYEYVRSHTQGGGEYYVMLDEVQLMPEFEDVLNGFLHFGNVDVYVTGSNSKFLSTDVITEFRGRGDEVRVHPLTFAEFFSTWKGDWESAWNAYYTYGGMPRIAGMDDEAEKIEYLERLFTETYFRDIVERNSVNRPEELEELVDFIASAIGSLTNPALLAATFKSAKGVDISEATIGSYLTYLEDAFLVSRAKRYDVRGRRAIGSPYKYYFEDVGLRNARLKFRQQEPAHIMENVIYNELRLRGYAVDVGVIETRTTVDGKSLYKQWEVDFIATDGLRKFYIQSAYALPTDEECRQELAPLKKIDDSFRKIVIVAHDIATYTDANGFIFMGLFTFLLNDALL